MASLDSLDALLEDELRDIYDAEKQIAKALPKIMKKATAPELKGAVEEHLRQTEGQIERLEEVFEHLELKAKGKKCIGMHNLLKEGDEMMRETKDRDTRDALIIAAAQKVEHYEMASYGTARTYAEVLGEPVVARLLAQTLKEEKAADGKLTAIAEGSVNEEAAEEWRAQEDDGLVERSTAWMGQTIDAASRQLAGSARRAAAAMGFAQDRPKAAAARGARGRKAASRGTAARKRR